MLLHLTLYDVVKINLDSYLAYLKSCVVYKKHALAEFKL